MHGRLKVKTTAEQDAAKLKEREQKKEKYQTAMNAMIKMRNTKVFDNEALNITGKLLQAIPDSTTVWNYRREILNNMASQELEEFAGIQSKELSMTEMCLLNNPKSYGTWHHRSWVLQNLLTNPSWTDELEICDKYLKLDPRNFHCWDHRRLVVQLSNHCLKKELSFTTNLIETNLSNYSAWHYRSKLLPIVHPAADGSSLHLDEEIFLKELKNVVSAVFTDPSDQSPWFYLRWLLREKEKQEEFVQVGRIEIKSKLYLALVMSHPTPRLRLKEVIRIDNYIMDEFENYDDEQYIWITPLKEEFAIIKVQFGEMTMPCVVSNVNGLVEPTIIRSSSKSVLNNASWNAILEIRDNCFLLEEIDPNNKWVLLTLVDFLKVIDLVGNLSDIKAYLDKLQEIDPLRKNYYVDAKTKLITEVILRKYIAEQNRCFSLREEKVKLKFPPQLLLFATKIDISMNSVMPHEWTKYFALVEELVLDGDQLNYLSPSDCLPLLKSISIRKYSHERAKKSEFLNSLPKHVNIKFDQFPETEER